MDAGFYKNDNGSLLSGLLIENKHYILDINRLYDYDLPIAGWFYFENEIDARKSLNCPIEISEQGDL